jgi:excisionase family DNA binding protein
MVKASSDILTLPQAARLAGLSPITLRVQIRNGRLRATKLGRDWFVTQEELRDYLKSVGK